MSLMSTFIARMGDEDAPVFIRYTVSRPVFGILMIENEDDDKTPV